MFFMHYVLATLNSPTLVQVALKPSIPVPSRTITSDSSLSKELPIHRFVYFAPIIEFQNCKWYDLTPPPLSVFMFGIG